MNSQIGYGNQFHLSKIADRKNKITVYGKLIDNQSSSNYGDKSTSMSANPLPNQNK